VSGGNAENSTIIPDSGDATAGIPHPLKRAKGVTTPGAYSEIRSAQVKARRRHDMRERLLGQKEVTHFQHCSRHQEQPSPQRSHLQTRFATRFQSSGSAPVRSLAVLPVLKSPRPGMEFVISHERYSSFVTKEIQPTSLTGGASFVPLRMLSPNTLPELSAAYASDCSNDSFGRSLVPVGEDVFRPCPQGNAAGSQDQMLGTHGECPGLTRS